MGIYSDQIVPRMVDKMLDNRDTERWRLKAMDGLAGVVVEPGFGSGLNVPHYPDDVTKVYALDPATVGRSLGAERIAASDVEIEFVGLDGQEIPLEDDSCDAALLTFTLCTIPDPSAALREIERVVRPGGRLHFVEHGLSPDDSIAKWQRRIDPVQKRLADGCHLTRDAPALIEAAGFALDRCERSYAKGPKPWTWFSVGQATKPSASETLV